ncbi:ATP-binding cassette domain-containing protein [Teichococcus vastitatis]|uniref:ATP-binding cassette domain-containing protein n=1 Tax=Teichococcus vastitatis TaxID=2307076 RepID=UPI00192E3D55|nr:ABC transporter ATP-binding protein [Pseudoroseomonas vastitatis]
MKSRSGPVLSVRGLSLDAGQRQIVHDLSFAVGRGERVCLLGESGSGKSLTAGAVLGLLPANINLKGSIAVAGHEVSRLPAPLRPASARVAMVFQDSYSALNPLVSIGSQLQEPLRRRQGLGAMDARIRAVELLAAMGLPNPEDMLRRCPPEISGGQRQRACIALALACKTSLLVADEPTTALDVVTQAQVLRALKAGTEEPDAPGLLFITHDLGAAAQLCDRAIIIKDGAIVEAGDLAAVLAAPRHDYTRRLIAAAQAGSIDRASPSAYSAAGTA